MFIAVFDHSRFSYLENNKSKSQVEEREVNVWENEEQRDRAKCCVILSKLSLNQPSIVWPGEVVSNVSSDILTSKPVVYWKYFLENVIPDAVSVTELRFGPYNILWVTSRSIISDYYMTFSVLARDSHSKRSWRAHMGQGWYQGRYGKFHRIFYIDLFQALTFTLQKRSLNWQIAKINPSENCLCSTCIYFCFESGFKNVPNNVDLYNDVRNCL